MLNFVLTRSLAKNNLSSLHPDAFSGLVNLEDL